VAKLSTQARAFIKIMQRKLDERNYRFAAMAGGQKGHIMTTLRDKVVKVNRNQKRIVFIIQITAPMATWNSPVGRKNIFNRIQTETDISL